MVAALMLLLSVLVVAEIIERLVALVASDGHGRRASSGLPRSHRGEVRNPLR